MRKTGFGLQRDEQSGMSVSLYQAVEKTRSLLDCFKTVPPEIGIPGERYSLADSLSWVAGFYSGILWLSYIATEEALFKNSAREQLQYFQNRLVHDSSVDHDIGFLLLPSVVADYALTGNKTARGIGIVGADLLIDRYKKTGKYIRAWNENTYYRNGSTGWSNSGRMIIDTMMNISLLFWATRETGSNRYAEAAESHSLTTAKHLIRENGSTYHTFIFDSDSGTPIRPETYQGYSDSSVWSRGQAWALYGFINAYRHSHNQFFLDIAGRIAEYILKKLETAKETMPLWDYEHPEPDTQPVDTSAGMITASAFLDLAELSDCILKQQLKRYAFRLIVEAIQNYSLLTTNESDGFISNVAVNVPLGFLNTISPIGDYFFLEAVGKLNGIRLPVW